MSQSPEISKRRQKTAAKRDLISIGNDLIHVAMYYKKKCEKMHAKLNGDSKPVSYSTSIALDSKVKTKTGREVTERQLTVFTNEEADVCFARLKEYFAEAVESFVEINKRTANREYHGAGGLVTVGKYVGEFTDYYNELDATGVTLDIGEGALDVITGKALCTPLIVKRALRLDWLSVRKEGEKMMYVTPRMKKFLPKTLAVCKASGMNLDEFTYAQMGRLASKLVVPKTELSEADKKAIADETNVALLKEAYDILKPKDEEEETTEATEDAEEEPAVKPVAKPAAKKAETNGHAAPAPAKKEEKEESKPEPAQSTTAEASVRRPRQRRQGTSTDE